MKSSEVFWIIVLSAMLCTPWIMLWFKRKK